MFVDLSLIRLNQINGAICPCTAARTPCPCGAALAHRRQLLGQLAQAQDTDGPVRRPEMERGLRHRPHPIVIADHGEMT